MKRVLSIVFLLLGAAWAAMAQGYQIKGVVEDALGPVIGATVLEKDTTTGTSTGLDGDFILTVSSPDAIVEVSCIGYSTRSFKASEIPASILLRVRLPVLTLSRTAATTLHRTATTCSSEA